MVTKKKLECDHCRVVEHFQNLFWDKLTWCVHVHILQTAKRIYTKFGKLIGHIMGIKLKQTVWLTWQLIAIGIGVYVMFSSPM